MHIVRKHRHFLAGLCDLTPRQRSAVLRHGTKEQITCITEIVLNILRNNVRLAPAVRTQLKKHKKKLRKLICPKTNLVQRRALLVQKGGFLPLIIKPIAGILAGLLPTLFGK